MREKYGYLVALLCRPYAVCFLKISFRMYISYALQIDLTSIVFHVWLGYMSKVWSDKHEVNQWKRVRLFEAEKEPRQRQCKPAQAHLAALRQK